jgi:serine/threonine protein kinase
MKLVCNYGNIAEEGSYWCRTCERNCRPGQLSLIFEAGERIDDMEVIEFMRIFPAAALYRVKQDNKVVIVKVAHQGFEEPLKQEARFLMSFQHHPAFPNLISTLHGDERPYRKFTVKEQIKYYFLLRNVEGEFMRDLLNRQIQLPPEFSAWLTISLADAIAFLNVKGGRLLNQLSPDTIFVRVDKIGVPRPTLLDLSAVTTIGAKTSSSHITSGYMSPEQIRSESLSVTSDIYSLGAILYEMLAGQSLFASKLQRDEELRTSILYHEPVPLKQRRPELVAGVSDIIQQALEKDPARRQSDVRTFAKGLRTLFGEVPAEPKRIQLDRRIIAVGVFILLVILLFVLLMVVAKK